jgi:signal peptidase I
MSEAWKTRCRHFWIEWVRPILIILIVACSLRSAVADWNYVPSGSMKPTIMEGDRIFVNRLAYDLKVPFTTWHILEWGDPERGDVVVLYSPKDEKRLVKRVIGIPGDVLELVNNRLYVNGQPAVYERLEEDLEREIDSEERPFHEFARERVGDQSHPVMITLDRWGSGTFGPVEVPAGQYFVMGDNRDNSSDSRTFGCVERRRILGRATATAISVDPQNCYWPRWHRFFRNLP